MCRPEPHRAREPGKQQNHRRGVQHTGSPGPPERTHPARVWRTEGEHEHPNGHCARHSTARAQTIDKAIVYAGQGLPLRAIPSRTAEGTRMATTAMSHYGCAAGRERVARPYRAQGLQEITIRAYGISATLGLAMWPLRGWSRPSGLWPDTDVGRLVAARQWRHDYTRKQPNLKDRHTDQFIRCRRVVVGTAAGRQHLATVIWPGVSSTLTSVVC